MSYIEFLNCNEFKKDFEEFMICDITNESRFSEVDFEYPTEDFDEELIQFFVSCDVQITEIHNYPISYEVVINDEIIEYFDIQFMFIELIEKIYGYNSKEF